jgi:hypothetical protein
MYTRNLHRRQDCKLLYISKSIADKQGGCGYLDIITFYHHAGLIAAAVQDFPLAVELLSIVSLTIPGSLTKGRSSTHPDCFRYSGRSSKTCHPLRVARHWKGMSPAIERNNS